MVRITMRSESESDESSIKCDSKEELKKLQDYVKDSGILRR